MTATVPIRELRDELTRLRETHPRSSSVVLEAFERLFRAASAAGQPLDGLRRHTSDEVERFFANTIPGVDGHVYWDGWKQGFRRNDGKYRVPRRWWWAHVNGRELGPYEDLVPMCGERNCITPEHADVGRSLRRYRFTQDQMLGAVQVAALRLGRPPNSKEWDSLGLSPTRAIYQARFGSWENVIRSAGLDYDAMRGPLPSSSPSVCIKSLRFVRERIGHWPSIREFRAAAADLQAADLPSGESTIKKYLGGWPEACRKAGARRRRP